MTTFTNEVPDDLCARWTDAPRLAWIVSRAFGIARRRGLGGDLWAVPAALLGYMPIVLAATLTRRAATDKDRTAVLIVYPGRRSFVLLWFVVPLWLAAVGGVACLAVGPALDGATTITQLWVRTAALLAAYGAVWVPCFVDTSAVAIRGLRPDVLGTLRHAAHLRRAGKPCAAISIWSAWPLHRGAGRRLADDLLHHMPSELWLVATARDTTVAQWLHDRGFRPTGRGLLMERAGDPSPSM